MNATRHMKRITEKRLNEILTLSAIKSNVDKREAQHMLQSIKIGKAAAEHLDSEGCAAYFSTESTILADFYYDASRLWGEWFEFVREELSLLGFHLQEVNSTQYAIYRA
jgi:hypothetical protein